MVNNSIKTRPLRRGKGWRTWKNRRESNSKYIAVDAFYEYRNIFLASTNTCLHISVDAIESSSQPVVVKHAARSE